MKDIFWAEFERYILSWIWNKYIELNMKDIYIELDMKDMYWAEYERIELNMKDIYNWMKDSDKLGMGYALVFIYVNFMLR